jgi:hypothetical protein
MEHLEIGEGEGRGKVMGEAVLVQSGFNERFKMGNQRKLGNLLDISILIR